MKTLRHVFAGAALLALLAAPLLYLFGVMTLDVVKVVLLAATIVWFAAQITAWRQSP